MKVGAQTARIACAAPIMALVMTFCAWRPRQSSSSSASTDWHPPGVVMAWSDCLDGLNEAAVTAFAATASYQVSGQAAVSCRAVVSRSFDPIMAGGEIVIDEDHYTAMIPASDLTGAPAEGATLTVGSDVFRVEMPGAWNDGLWKLVLRKR